MYGYLGEQTNIVVANDDNLLDWVSADPTVTDALNLVQAIAFTGTGEASIGPWTGIRQLVTIEGE